jgi:hypothetical protein
MAGLLTPARVDQSARMPGGLLSKSLPAPSGWERGGLAIPFYGCGEPVLRDKCVEGTDVPHRSEVAEFPSIPIEQGVTCSLTGPDDLRTQALDRFVSSADWALGRQLQTDAIDSGAPKLDDATPMGTVADAQFISAVACLEQAAADAGFGSRFVLHAPVRAAAYLASQGLLDTNGLGPTGQPWIISAGYENPSGTVIRLWATGQVWASVDTPEVVEPVGYQTNDIDAWARGLGVVAFDPCILVSIDVTVGACP